MDNSEDERRNQAKVFMRRPAGKGLNKEPTPTSPRSTAGCKDDFPLNGVDCDHVPLTWGLHPADS